MAIKLNLATSGANTNVNIAQLYEEAKLQNVPRPKWNEWIYKQVKEDGNKQTNLRSVSKSQ